MKLLKQHQFWLSLALRLGLFAAFLYCKWTGCTDADGRSIFFCFTVMQTIGRSIFAIMNRGSRLFIGLSAAVIICLAAAYFKTTRE